MIKAIPIFCALLMAAGVGAQQTVPIKGAVGNCVIANISPEKAKETALFNAKLDALRKAGIAENLIVDVTQMGEIFLETSNLEIGGGITGFDLVSDNIRFIEQGGAKVLVAEVVINATVMKYTHANDPSFRVQVQGVRSAYREKETLTFSVTPYQDGYLRIFLFEEDGAGDQLYPDKEKEPDVMFRKDKTMRFPLNGQYYYRLEKSDKNKAKEINRILFLFLKDNVHFTGNHISLQAVSNWKATISPDRRTQVFTEFAIER
ncbi:MAG: DUF4384 domain-containing protein [Tannerellaceae bacterium]|jgi:hypothetical protein|nr:DUF4384 domain-containing protein [Tannerellaceae bacterium]